MKKMRLTLKKLEDMTPGKFQELSLEEQYEFLRICKADYETVQDLIRDRNEFKDLYYELYQQLLDNGITPIKDYFKNSPKGRKKKNV